MKPVYLLDIVLEKVRELAEGKEPKTIGRHPDCDFVTDSKDTSISRVQGEIVYRANQVFYKQLSENSKTYIGTLDDPRETQVHQEITEPVSFGNFITMGNRGYQFQLKSGKDKEVEFFLEQEKKRLEDTQKVRTDDLLN